MVLERFNILTPPGLSALLICFLSIRILIRLSCINSYYRCHKNPRFQLYHHYVIMFRYYKLNG